MVYEIFSQLLIFFRAKDYNFVIGFEATSSCSALVTSTQKLFRTSLLLIRYLLGISYEQINDKEEKLE